MKKLRPDDLVTVRSFPDIATTRDATGALDGLPFLPEMMKYCGHMFSVRRRVNKLIPEGVGASMRRIKNIVLLEGAICDGQAHGDCQRACFPLWKTAWLMKAQEKLVNAQGEAKATSDANSEHREVLLPFRKGCQVTELIKATKPLPFWHPMRHYWDFTSRTYSPKENLVYILGGLYRKTLKRIIGKLARVRFPLLAPIPTDSCPVCGIIAASTFAFSSLTTG